MGEMTENKTEENSPNKSPLTNDARRDCPIQAR
jgi:hypothetical protein